MALMARGDGLRAKEIGRRIKQARQEAGGMTQRELAELIGVTERSVAAYEAGDIVPFRLLGKIEDAVARDKAWILYGDESVRGSVGTLENQEKGLKMAEEISQALTRVALEEKQDKILANQRKILRNQDRMIALLEAVTKPK